MIRTVRIPPLSMTRLGQTVLMTPGCISYQDPNTGLWIANDGSECSAGDGTSAANPIVSDDPGLASALAAFADSSSSVSSQAALNAGVPSPSFALAESLMSGNIPSPLPGLGVTVPTPLKNWLIIAAVVAGALLLLDSPRSSRR